MENFFICSTFTLIFKLNNKITPFIKFKTMFIYSHHFPYSNQPDSCKNISSKNRLKSFIFHFINKFPMSHFFKFLSKFFLFIPSFHTLKTIFQDWKYFAFLSHQTTKATKNKLVWKFKQKIIRKDENIDFYIKQKKL